MRKRTLGCLILYFFLSTNARKIRESNKTSLVKDTIADMVRTFAFSGLNGSSLLGKSDKGKVGSSSYANAFSSILNMLLENEKPNESALYYICLGVYNDMLKVPEWLDNHNVSKQCGDGVRDVICNGFKNLEGKTKADIAKKLLMHSPITKMIDAWSKIPERILLANGQWLGSYEECSNVEEAKYCNSDINVNMGGMEFPIQYGTCFPRKCSTEDADLLVKVFFKKIVTTIEELIKKKLSIIGIKDFKIPLNIDRTLCDNEVDYYTLGWKITAVVTALVALLCAIGTAIEAYMECKEDYTDEAGEVKEEVKMNDHTIECGIKNPNFKNSTSQLTLSKSVSTNNILADDPEGSFRCSTVSHGGNNKTCNYLLDFFLCFSLIRNSKAIFSTKISEGTVRSINGIRVISFTWVLLGNFHLYAIGGLKTDNIYDVMNSAIHKFTFLCVSNAYVSVDSFFVLSGFLASYLFVKKFGKKGMRVLDALYSYFHRYLRLTPSLGLVIIMYNFLPQILKGPMALNITQTDEMSGGCHNYWWSVIFYFNNFFPSYKDGCLAWTFYLANDMQFFVLSPLILMVMMRIEKMTHKRVVGILYNFFFLMAICCVSFLITGLLTYKYNLPSIATTAMLLDSPFNETQRDGVINMIYMKPYCRITPYLAGLFLGYLVAKDVKPSKSMKPFITIIGWIFSILGGLTVVYGPWRVFREEADFFSPAETAFYAATHRFVWGCSVAWVIYACCNRMGGIINKFLSWKVWMPLSRLTYSAFLVHLEIIYIFTFCKEIPIHYQINDTVFSFISITVVTYVGAFALAVCLEYPILNVEKFVRRVF